MKKILLIALAIVLVFSGLTPIHAETSSSELYNEAGNILFDLGLLSGNGSGDLMLNKNLNRQDMVVMISRLFKEEDNAKNYVVKPGQNKFKDLTVNEKYYIPYITWAVQKNLIKGMSDNEFGFGKEVTVQQFQTVLLRALGYNKDADDWDMVPEMAKKYHLMENLSGVNPSLKLNRGQMSLMTVNSLRQEMNGKDTTLAQALGVTIPEQFKVDVVAKVENNSLIFNGQAKGTSFLVLRLKPISSNITTGERVFNIPTNSEGTFSYRVDNLEVGNYHYRFESGSKYTNYLATTIDVLPFDLVDVKASNLKEITLTYTQAVDPATASLISNFNTTAGSIKDVRLEGNNTKIILTLNGAMTQQMKYKISTLKIKSVSGEEKQLTDSEFDVFDGEIPRVLSIKQLGTKGIRVYLSEPIKTALINNFKVDGKNFPGNVKLENNIVTLTYISSVYALSEGTHTLTVSGLEDYAGLKIIDENIQFSISKDTTPPVIVGASATLEEVTIEFNEDIDPISAVRNNFYWKSGSTKRYATNVVFEGTKAKVEFTTNKLSTNENTIYVENVVDYSNNKMKAMDIKVIPVIDMTNPEVINHVLSTDGKTITIYYSKNVTGNLRTNYSILDKDNKSINIRDIQGSGREFKINLYSPLPVGINTLTIQGVQDTTPLKNLSIPYITTIDMKDIEKPRLINQAGYANNIILNFSKQMDMATVVNPDNYFMTFGSSQYKLPSNTLFTPSNDGKSVTMLLPENFEDKKIMIGAIGNLTSLNIVGLRDISGNDTDPLIMKVTFDGTSTGKGKAIDYYKDKTGRQGVLIESNLIKVRFNIPIVQASPSDFSIVGRTITSVIPDGTDEVSIYLNDSNTTYIPQNSLSILANNNMKTYIDTGVESGTILLFDEVAPRVKDSTYSLTVYGNQIELPFTEVLGEEGSTLYRRDLEIIRLADGKVMSKDDYTTSLKPSDKTILLITITKRDIASGYSIRLSGEAGSGALSYIRDIDGNLSLPSETFFTSTDIPKQ